MVVYFHSQILSYGEWNTNWFLFELKRVAARGPPVPLPFCHGDGSVERPYQKGYEGGLLSQGVKFSMVEGGLSTLPNCSLPMTQLFFVRLRRST